MKWVALLFFLLVGAGLTLALRKDPRAALVAAFALGFLPFVTAPWHLIVAPYTIAGWPGYVKGWEVGLIDAIAVACLIGIPRSRSELPFKYVFLLYIASAVVAAFLAPSFKIAFSYPIQLARVFLVFVAVARLCSTELGLKHIMQGLIAGLCYQAAVAVWARFGGALQTGGSLGHQNLLGFVSHMAFIPAFGLLLSGLWTRWAIAGLISGAIVVTLTVSRATIAFAAIGLIITYLLSATSNWSGRKLGVGLASLALIGLSFPIIQYSFERRFAAQGKSSFMAPDEEREAFERAARTMIGEHPFGVGPNYYVVVVNTQGYASRAGVGWSTGSRATNVHNSFLLIWAETGLFGLITIVLLFARIVLSSLARAFRTGRSAQADLLIGVVGALTAVAFHSLYEWMLLIYPAQYLLAIVSGVAAGLIRQLKGENLKKELATSIAGRHDRSKVPVSASIAVVVSSPG